MCICFDKDKDNDKDKDDQFICAAKVDGEGKTAILLVLLPFNPVMYFRKDKEHKIMHKIFLGDKDVF